MSKREAIPSAVRKDVLQEPRCCLCGGGKLEIEGETWVVDHVLPRSRCGGDDRSNLHKAHSTCNGWRSDKPITTLMVAKIVRRRAVELYVQG